MTMRVINRPPFEKASRSRTRAALRQAGRQIDPDELEDKLEEEEYKEYGWYDDAELVAPSARSNEPG